MLLVFALLSPVGYHTYTCVHAYTCMWFVMLVIYTATPAAVVRDGGGRGERSSGDDHRVGQGGERIV